MATITAAILCDFAQVRQGLLFVSSGGITRRITSTVPTDFNVMLAAMVEVPANEQAQAHELVVAIKRADTAEEMGRLVAGGQFNPTDAFPGESVYAPIVADLRAIKVPGYGSYDVAMSVDSGPLSLLTFYVVPPPRQP